MFLFRKVFLLVALLFLAGCKSVDAPSNINDTATTENLNTEVTSKPSIPNFDHIVIVVLENWDSEDNLRSPLMPNYNKLADEYTFLDNYYGIWHPSLPNYIAMISGDTFDITENCTDCFIDAPSLPDMIEVSGRTWKTYQEDMPSPCFIGSEGDYEQKHNPFIYFDAIRLDKERCERSIVPFSAFLSDVEAGTLPNFIFITPNICNDGHDCSFDVTDKWLMEQLKMLIPALDNTGGNYLVVMMFEEGEGDGSCCGLPEDDAGGLVPVVLISPQAKNNFRDSTPYSHYSLLKTIANAWGLPYLGHAADAETSLITAPWK